jgi:predicted DCC family thiol-disulfide oxidoreductase YuxK
MGKHIILYDDTCRLCNNTIKILKKADKNRLIQFIPLNSSKGQEHLDSENQHYRTCDSVVYIHDNMYVTKSDAILLTLKLIRRYRFLYYLKYIIPQRLRDLIYDIVARNRHKW